MLEKNPARTHPRIFSARFLGLPLFNSRMSRGWIQGASHLFLSPVVGINLWNQGFLMIYLTSAGKCWKETVDFPPVDPGSFIRGSFRKKVAD